MKNKLKEKIVKKFIERKLGKKLEKMDDKELAVAEGFFEKFLLEHNPSKLIELQKKYKKGMYAEDIEEKMNESTEANERGH